MQPDWKNERQHGVRNEKLPVYQMSSFFKNKSLIFSKISSECNKSLSIISGHEIGKIQNCMLAIVGRLCKQNIKITKNPNLQYVTRRERFYFLYSHS